MINTDLNTEQSILEAAEQLFLEKGFAMTTTTEIAKKADCNQALVHYYYRSKDKLFEAIFENKARLFISQFLTIENKNLSFEEKLKLKIEAHFDILEKNPRLPFLLLNEFTTNPQRLLRLKARMGEWPSAIFSELKNELDAEIEKGNIRKIEVIDLLLTVISLNIVVFVAKSAIKTITGMSEDEYNRLVKKRRKENVEIILKSIKP